MVDIYFDQLATCSLYQVKRAIEEITQNGDNFPYLSKIFKLARSLNRCPSKPMPDNLQIEEVTAPAGSPTTKEEFFVEMKKLCENVSINN